MIVYMTLWDLSEIKVKIDFLCTIRGYINYIGIASIYHTYILQALYRYLHVKRITKFDSIYFRLLFIISQWIIDILIPLPILLHGDLNEVSSGNICALSLFSIWILVFVSIMVYFSSLGIILMLYRQVILHVKESGATATRQLNSNRDIVIFRRIIQILIALVLCGLPYMLFFLVSLINPSIIPDYYLHIAYISSLLSVLVQMIILIMYTPSVKKCLIDIKTHYFHQNNRVLPFFTTNQSQ